MRKYTLLSICLLIILQASCTSIDSLTGNVPSLYFRRAEQEKLKRNRQSVVEIYKLIQFRFADDFALMLEAEFSIAQLYFSWNGHDKQAYEHYQNVLRFYKRPEVDSDLFPQSYLYLSEKNLKILAERSKFRFFPPKTYGVHSYPPNQGLER